MPWQFQRGLYVPQGFKPPADALTPAERSSLGSPVQAFNVARKSGVAAALKIIPPDFNGAVPNFPGFDDARRALYVDSNKGVPYWVFESAFSTDRSGARYFLHLLMDIHPAVTPELLETGDLLAVASGMRGYYDTSMPAAQYAAWLERNAGHAGDPNAFAGMMAPLLSLDPTNIPHDDGYDAPTPMPPDWGKGLASSGGEAEGSSSQSVLQSESGSESSQPFRTVVVDTLDLETDELEDTKA
jgi:hypothetical protein